MDMEMVNNSNNNSLRIPSLWGMAMEMVMETVSLTLTEVVSQEVLLHMVETVETPMVVETVVPLILVNYLTPLVELFRLLPPMVVETPMVVVTLSVLVSVVDTERMLMGMTLIH
jgi:hypothetical protein